MSLFSKVKDSIFESVPEAHTEAPKLPPTAPVKTPTLVVTQHVEYANKPDPQALAKLEKLVQDTNQPIYANFMEQFKNLEDVVPDEATRLKAALKTVKSSKEQVISAIDYLISRVNTAREDFQKSFQDNVNKTESQSKQSISATEDLIVSKEAQLKAIQEEILSLRSKRETDFQHYQSEHARLQNINTGFEAAYQQVVGSLNDQKNRISTIPSKG